MGATQSSGGLTSALHSLSVAGAPEDPAGFARLLDKLLPRRHAVHSEQLFATLQPADVRHLLATQPRSLARVIAACISALEGVCAAASAPQPSTASHTRALNAVRLLTRLLPVVLEGGEGSDFARRLFWEGSGHLPAAPGAPAGAAWEPLIRQLPKRGKAAQQEEEEEGEEGEEEEEEEEEEEGEAKEDKEEEEEG